MPPGWLPRCSVTVLPATCFCLVLPTRRDWCRCRPRPSAGPSSSTAWRSISTARPSSGGGGPLTTGRRTAHDRAAVERLAAPVAGDAPHCRSLEEIVADRMARLTAYQNAAYAERYRALLERVRLADCAVEQKLSRAVARYYFKLLAYKDEYH